MAWLPFQKLLNSEISDSWGLYTSLENLISSGTLSGIHLPHSIMTWVHFLIHVSEVILILLRSIFQAETSVLRKGVQFNDKVANVDKKFHN